MQPDLSGVVGDVVGQIQQRARQLGLTWELAKGTVAAVTDSSQVTVVLDGDTVPVGATSMIGYTAVGNRVWVLIVPPGGLYVIGHVAAQQATDYTPLLTATVTPPTLGTGAVQLGRWWRNPITGWIDCQVTIRFGTAGTAAGSGAYLIELPTAVDAQQAGAGTGFSDIIGHGILSDSGVASVVSQAHLSSAAGGTGGVGQVLLLFVSPTAAANAANNAPWVWGANDGMSFSFSYPPA